MNGKNRPLSLWWTVPAASFVLVLLLAMVFGTGPESSSHPHTSFSARPEGTRAAYLLLEELGYPVERWKRPTGGEVRWVLFPSGSPAEAGAVDQWIRAGGTLVLADDSKTFAQYLGIALTVDKQSAATGEEPASGLDIARLDAGKTRVTWPESRPVRVLVEAGDKPVVTVYSRGQGELWLINRPELLTNALVGNSDNGVLVCRLAEASLRGQSGNLLIDEYFHGMRERPGVVALLFQPPLLWVTLEGGLLTGLLLWRFIPRFGTILPPAIASRRSRQEFLDAMAALLERKADYRDAYRTVRDGLLGDLARELGLPPGTPALSVAQAAARRHQVPPGPLLQTLSEDLLTVGAGKRMFLDALNRLETVRDELHIR